MLSVLNRISSLYQRLQQQPISQPANQPISQPANQQTSQTANQSTN